MFVHGLGGHWLKTWSHNGETIAFWPHWIAEGNPDMAVWALEYPAVRTAWRGPSMSILEYADDALDCLRLREIGKRPLVFVCHSLGGLLVKQMLRTATERQSVRHIGEATIGVAFFATPNTGSRIATVAGRAIAILGPLGMLYRGSEILRELRANGPQIRNLNDWFRNYVAARPAASALRVKAWYETRGSFGIFIVDATSANPGIVDVTPLAADGDHFTVCKPRDAQDRRILNVVELCDAPAQATLTTSRSRHLLYRRRTLFVGRDREKRQLAERLAGGGRATICAVAGMGGVGKTELALQVAGDLGDDAFPDSIVIVDLQGTPDPTAAATGPLSPEDAMQRVLVQLDPTTKPPEEADALAHAYRRALVGKHLLLILDNARDVAQVTPLVPPEPVALLVTSRTHLELPEALTLDLDTLDPGDALTLLKEEIGTARLLDDATLVRFAELCGNLPVALLAIAGTIKASRTRSPEQLLARLEADRAKGLTGVLDRLRLSAEALAEDNLDLARRFARLAVFARDFSVEAAVYVWGVDEDTAGDDLEELLTRSLLLPAAADGPELRFRLHDLIRELATKLVGDEADAAALRHATFYKDLLARCDRLYLAGNDAVLEGLALFDRERAEITAGQRWAAEHADSTDSAARLAADYPSVGEYTIALRLNSRTLFIWLDAALAACRRIHDQVRECKALGNLGLAWTELGEPRKAIEYCQQQFVIAQKLGDRRSEGNALGNLGLAWADLGEPLKAIELYEQQLVITREIGDRRNEGNALGNLGSAKASLGDPRKAIELYEQQLVIAREIGDRWGEGIGLGSLGHAWTGLGDPRKGIELYEQQLVIAREIGDRRSEANGLSGLGLAWAHLGEPSRAVEFHQQSLVIAREMGDRRGEGIVLCNMADVHEKLGETKASLASAKAGFVIFREIEHPGMLECAKWLRERGVDPDSL